MLVKEKVDQAIGILEEYGVDCWITFVRESGMMRDPMMAYLCPAEDKPAFGADHKRHRFPDITRAGVGRFRMGDERKRAAGDAGEFVLDERLEQRAQLDFRQDRIARLFEP